MVDIGSTLMIQQETDEAAIQNYCGMSVQPFFRSKSFYRLNHKDLCNWFYQSGINILSLHYPSIQDNFTENLKILSDTYDVKLFTVHPTGETLDDCLSQLSRIESQVASLGVKLSIENLPAQGKWHNDPRNLYRLANEFSFVSLTYDTTHLPKYMDAVEGFDPIQDKVSIIHLSNVKYGLLKRTDHLPIDEGERDLHHFLSHLAKSSYQGQIVIEYRRHDPHFLKQEVEKVNRVINAAEELQPKF
jgi:sugar phosphate isomerase/epimerase